MKQCPKCGCCNISGPHYTQVNWQERLKYSCLRCGYTTTTPTLDHRETFIKDDEAPMSNPHPAQIKWKDPLALARDIRKRLHLIADPSVRLDMEACCDAIEEQGNRIDQLEESLRYINDQRRFPAIVEQEVSRALR